MRVLLFKLLPATCWHIVNGFWAQEIYDASQEEKFPLIDKHHSFIYDYATDHEFNFNESSNLVVQLSNVF